MLDTNLRPSFGGLIANSPFVSEGHKSIDTTITSTMRKTDDVTAAAAAAAGRDAADKDAAAAAVAQSTRCRWLAAERSAVDDRDADVDDEDAGSSRSGSPAAG